MAITVIDTNVLVGLLDSKDKWHSTAVAIRDILNKAGAELVFFYFVVNEAMSVLVRRANEQKRLKEIGDLLDNLIRLIPPNDISWISEDTRRLYDQIVGLVKSSAGLLNFNDALIALTCREQKISFLISFDCDFDQINWIKRLDNADAISSALL